MKRGLCKAFEVGATGLELTKDTSSESDQMMDSIDRRHEPPAAAVWWLSRNRELAVRR